MTSEIILQAIVTGLMMGLIYALIAAGLSLIFGLMEIVNFAHGEHLMLSMFSSFWLWSLFGLDPLFSIPITILLLAFCGIITHYFLIRYILKAKMLIEDFERYEPYFWLVVPAASNIQDLLKATTANAA